MKKIFLLLLSSFLLLGIGFAQDYIFFYGNGCSHCAKVEEFLKENDVYKKFNIQEKEIYFNNTNRQEFLAYGEKLNISNKDIGIPLLIVNNENTCTNLIGDKKIIDYFTEKLAEESTDSAPNTCISTEPISGSLKLYDENLLSPQETTNPLPTDTEQNITGTIISKTNDTLKEKLGFFAIMLPAAISDSINPCEFAVIILLLGTILIRTKSRRKVILTGLSFSLALFISYLLMGVGLWKVLSSASNVNVVKIIAGALGVLVGLANLKDVFWYGKGFVMEVPFSRRARLKSIVQNITSPIGAFCVGIVVSLFLLPCTSGPYITILSYLSAEHIDKIRGLIYLLIYNMVFILPMVIITFLVSLGKAKTEHLTIMKDKYNWLIHLIVGLLMLGLGAYCLLTI